MQFSARWQANVGLRLDGFRTDQISYVVGQPRLSLRFQPTSNLRWQVAYDRTAQLIHQLSNMTIALPSDSWVPSTRRVQPEIADQWTLLGEWFPTRQFTIQTEAYYKRLHNALAYQGPWFQDDQDIEKLEDWQERLAVGRGESYGWETLLQKPVGRFTGWIGYTWSHSRRRFSELNQGEWFPFNYDRRHDIDVGGTFHWKKNVDVSWGWGYASGFAITLPTAVYQEQPGRSYGDIVVYGQRNGQRTRATHRLDVGITFRKETRWGERTWEFSVYNAYNRRNPFSVYLRQRGDSFTPNQIRVWQTSLFPLIPSVNYRFKF